MEKTLAIKYIHPTLEFWIDFEVRDDSQWEWPYIIWYNQEITEPTQEELESAWILCEKEIEVTQKIQRMEEINKELLELWGSNALVSYEALDTIRTNKITSLTTEFNELKTDLDENYESTLVTDILNSIFS